MIDGLHDDTVAEFYVDEPFEEYDKQVKVKSLIEIVNHWIKQILINGVKKYKDDKVGEFEKYIPGECKSVLN